MFREEVQDRLDSLIKPEDSLGVPEETAAKMSMMRDRVISGLPKNRALCSFTVEAAVKIMHEMAMFEDASVITGFEL